MEKYIDQTAGIYLRLMQVSDTEDIVRWRNSDGVRKNFIYRAPFTQEGHLSWIKNQIEPGHVVQMMICEIADDRAVGSVYIRDIDRQNRKAEYGIFIGEEQARGRGIGTAAAKLMLRYCFEEEKLHKVFLRAISTNEQAIRSYEKAGFVKEAYLKDDVFVDGEFLDIVLMGNIHPQERND